MLSSGVKLGRGPRHSTQQTVQYDQSGIPNQIPSIPADVTTSRQPEPVPLPSAPVQQPQVPVTERTDALTKKPLDLEAEEETRKLETSRWLESHFGSESSHSSIEGKQMLLFFLSHFSLALNRNIYLQFLQSNNSWHIY